MRHMHQVKGANPFALTSFCPSGVVQTTCLPLMQEITGAKPVRDASFRAPKAFGAMHSFGMGISSVQFRVGGSSFWVAVRNGGHALPWQSSRAQVGFISPCFRRDTGNREAFPGHDEHMTPSPDASARFLFVMNSSRASTGGRITGFCTPKFPRPIGAVLRPSS